MDLVTGLGGLVGEIGGKFQLRTSEMGLCSPVELIVVAPGGFGKLDMMDERQHCERPVALRRCCVGQKSPGAFSSV